MNGSLTWLFAALVAALLVEGFLGRGRIYHFPFLAAVMTVGFILPQLPAVAADPFLPEGAYAKTMVLAILCIAMLRLGWSERARPLALFRVAFSERRLTIVAAVFSLAGAFFYARLSMLPGNLTIGTQMSGVPVAYLFFARLLTYGLAIALLCYARRPSRLLAAIILFDLLFYFQRIVMTGKRAETVELLMMAALPFWYYRRFTVPRPAVAAALVLGTVGMVSMGDYRQITGNAGPSFDRIARIDVIGNFRETLEDGGQEMRNAVRRIATIDRTQEFDYGAFHWNRIVFNYVPSQLFGVSFKQSLMVKLPAPARDYNPELGTTETGLVDAFQSFWYFGCLKFLLLAYVMARIWASAMEGQASAQIVYILSIVPAMHAVSHQTDWVVPVWVHMLFFLVPALWWCMAPQPAAARRGAMATPLPEGAR